MLCCFGFAHNFKFFISLGGAFIAEDGGQIYIKNSIFKSNIAIRNGGALKLLVGVKLFIENTIFEKNMAEDGSFLYGFDVSDPIFIINCTFKKNAGINNLLNIFNTFLIIKDSQFIENLNPSCFMIDSNFVGSNISIKNNYCRNLDYGCIFSGVYSNFDFNNLILESNGGYTSYIGNIYVVDCYLSIYNSFFLNFTKVKIGACIFSKQSNIFLKNDSFENFSPNCIYGEENSNFSINYSYFANQFSQDLSTIICNFCDFLIIENSEFNGGLSFSVGGAFSIKNANEIKINFTKFINNSALEAGGLYIYETNSTISHCLFKNNSAFFGRGGAIFFENKRGFNYNFFIDFSNFTLNKAYLEGGAIKYTDKIPKIEFTNFSNNFAIYGPNIASYAIRMGFQAFNKKDNSKINTIHKKNFI